ncbi:MAG: alpha/beta fold hydrolase, partial [Ilumatobacter sp.]|nr:alpha/beta fold hydrolase [Ilumatobacter sp.]
MVDLPEIRFAKAAGSSIAYEVYGDGPATICAVPPMAQNIELAWGSPRIRRMFERYASFSRQVVFDKRGTGMSDRSLDIPALDERVDELSAVMDAAGVDSAFVHGLSEGGPMAIMFAATYPDRVEGLILEGTAAALTSDERRAEMRDPEQLARIAESWQPFVEGWGTSDSVTLALFAPSLLADEEFAAWWPTYERHAASRDALMDLLYMNSEMDARGVVGRVECPVLIIHRTGDRIVPIEQARRTFELFDEAGADVRLVEVPGDDHYTFAGDLEPIADAIERFTTGRVAPRVPRPDHEIVISTMGRFEVAVDEQPVRTSSWGSKRARTLLKRLVAARGWPVTRDELFELLWPGDDSDRLGA